MDDFSSELFNSFFDDHLLERPLLADRVSFLHMDIESSPGEPTFPLCLCYLKHVSCCILAHFRHLRKGQVHNIMRFKVLECFLSLPHLQRCYSPNLNTTSSHFLMFSGCTLRLNLKCSVDCVRLSTPGFLKNITLQDSCKTLPMCTSLWMNKTCNKTKVYNYALFCLLLLS